MQRRELFRRCGVAGTGFLVASRSARGAADELGLLREGGEAFAPATGFGEVGNWGVASGEPGETSVTIWTRVPAKARASRDGVDEQGRSSGSLLVRWWIAERDGAGDATAGLVRFTGVALATPQNDDCVKVRVEGLRPGARYVYGFLYDDAWPSDTGFARTLPRADADIGSLRYAYVSCQYYGSGFYTVYQALAEDDVDFCVHLGDSIYERVKERDTHIQVRPEPVGEAFSLDDYRERYKRTLTDAWYREARRRFTWICLPDDHEAYNDYWGTDPAQADRRAAARQAYFEYTPIADSLFPSVERAFRFGRLATLVAMDERSYRDGPVCPAATFKTQCDAGRAPGRTLLGAAQKQWVKSTIDDSQTAWNVLLSEVLMMPQRVVDRPEGLAPSPSKTSCRRAPCATKHRSRFAQKKGPLYFTLDSWDGFPAERAEMAEFLASCGQGNTLVWTGDIHNCYSGHVKAGSTRAAFEMSTGSVTSYGVGDVFRLGTAGLVENLVRHANDHMVYVDLRRHMYVRVTLTPEDALFETVCPHTIARASSAFSTTARIRVARGSLDAKVDVDRV